MRWHRTNDVSLFRAANHCAPWRCVLVEIIYLHECWAHCICKRIAFWSKTRFSNSFSAGKQGRVKVESWVVYALRLKITWLSLAVKMEIGGKGSDEKVRQIQLFAIIVWCMHFRRINDVHGSCLLEFIDPFLWQLQTFIGFSWVCRAKKERQRHKNQLTSNRQWEVSKQIFVSWNSDWFVFCFLTWKKLFQSHGARDDDDCGRTEW